MIVFQSHYNYLYISKQIKRRAMRKKVFTLNGKKYYSEEEYNAARDKFLSCQDEQEQAVAQFGFASGYTVLAGSQSQRIVFNQK